MFICSTFLRPVFVQVCWKLHTSWLVLSTAEQLYVQGWHILLSLLTRTILVEVKTKKITNNIFFYILEKKEKEKPFDKWVKRKRVALDFLASLETRIQQFSLLWQHSQKFSWIPLTITISNSVLSDRQLGENPTLSSTQIP